MTAFGHDRQAVQEKFNGNFGYTNVQIVNANYNLLEDTGNEGNAYTQNDLIYNCSNGPGKADSKGVLPARTAWKFKKDKNAWFFIKVSGTQVVPFVTYLQPKYGMSSEFTTGPTGQFLFDVQNYSAYFLDNNNVPLPICAVQVGAYESKSQAIYGEAYGGMYETTVDMLSPSVLIKAIPTNLQATSNTLIKGSFILINTSPELGFNEGDSVQGAMLGSGNFTMNFEPQTLVTNGLTYLSNLKGGKLKPLVINRESQKAVYINPSKWKLVYRTDRGW